jgi:hypothetical protein
MNELIDGRWKVLHCQVERAKHYREVTGWSYEIIAKVFFFGKVSRQTVYLMCNPDKREKARATSRRLHNQKKYCNKEELKYKVGKSRAKSLGLKDFFNIKNNNQSNEKDLFVP